ncbi:MAG: RNA polymerase Rbp10 [Nitrososphaerota archaeon]
MASENSDLSTEGKEQSTSFNVIYACMRCGTHVTQSELSRLPEIKCICGFRVFSKLRPPIVKTIKAI